MEEFGLRNTNKTIVSFARIGEEIECKETLKKKRELLDLKLLIKETTETQIYK